MVRTLALLAAIAVLALACAPSVPARPDVLLVTLDTTRADHVGAYGAKTGATPTFDAIAADGVLFTRAWTVTPLTTPAHASIMTGLYPSAHGVRNNGRFRLPERLTTLAEVFRSAGYRTAAFVGGFPVSREFGFAKGFETFDDDFGKTRGGRPASERPADAVDARALAWLAKTRDDRRPFFLWLHYYDAHEPYEPPPAFARRFPSSPYDGEIAFADAEFGRVVRALRESGAWSRTIVAVTGDHGEGLGDHGELTHGLFVYEPTIHVPMVVRAPWAIPRGAKRSDLASVVDLAPSLASLAGLRFPGPVDGRALFGRRSPGSAEGDDPLALGPGRAVYAESFYAAEEYGWAPLTAVRRGGMKWIGAPHPERYDLDVDPGETNNLAGRDPDKDRAMVSLLATVARASSAHAAGSAAGQVSDDLLSRLQSLGYVGGGGVGAPASGAKTAGRDPKEALDDYNAYLVGCNLLKAGRNVVGLFARLVAGDPQNPEFRLRLAMAQKAAGDPRAAEATYRDLIRRYPSFTLATMRLADLLDGQKRYADVRDLWLALKAKGGAYAGVDARLAEAYLDAGQPAKALETCDGGLASVPGDAKLLVIAGRSLERLGRDGAAIERYRAALASRPTDTTALDAALILLRRAGRTEEAKRLLDDCIARSGGDPDVRARLSRL